MCRVALALLELLLGIAILGVLAALLMPAVQKVREEALRLKSVNQMRQIGLAIHNYAANHDQLLPFWSSFRLDLLPYRPPVTSVMMEIFPYTGATIVRTRDDESGDNDVPLYLSPADPTVQRYRSSVSSGLWIGGGAISYVTNYEAFQPGFRLGVSFPDGMTATMALGEAHAYCKAEFKRSWQTGSHQEVDERGRPVVLTWSPVRRATFADPTYGNVVPVCDAFGQTQPSRPGVTFQSRPPDSECDPDILQSYFTSLNVMMMDGSIRRISPQVMPQVFWSAVTPAGGETGFWD
jgi:type II secretory pathway pseudopilin PulG